MSGRRPARTTILPASLPGWTRSSRLKQQEAKAVGYSGGPYDALLDEYEPGATTAEITQVFRELRQDLVPLVERIIASGPQAETRHIAA